MGAIGLVVDSHGAFSNPLDTMPPGKLTATGQTLYRHAAGRQSRLPDAPALDPDSTVTLGSAGKILTHIAALQLVEEGVVTLDEPACRLLPELETLHVLTEDGVRPPATPITLRHLLLHTSGLADHDAIDSRFGEGAADRVDVAADAQGIVKMFSIPLLFDPGAGFAYGYGIHWMQLLVQRATSCGSFVKHMQEHVFDPLGLSSFTYQLRSVPRVWDRRLHMVRRVASADGADGRSTILADADDYAQGLMCSVSDMGRALGALMAQPSMLLQRQEHLDLLFNGQFAPDSASRAGLRGNRENFGFVTGKSGQDSGASPPKVNWGAAGLVAEETLPASALPAGTVAWEGMPNVLWAVNRERGLAAFFATQLVPVGDTAANGLALAFMRGAWTAFGKDAL